MNVCIKTAELIIFDATPFILFYFTSYIMPQINSSTQMCIAQGQKTCHGLLKSEGQI